MCVNESEEKALPKKTNKHLLTKLGLWGAAKKTQKKSVKVLILEAAIGPRKGPLQPKKEKCTIGRPDTWPLLRVTSGD